MSQLPMMPLWTDALLGDTTHLSAEEFGAYMLILCATWRNNGEALADDDKTMARICRVHISRWRQRLRPALIGFFIHNDGCLHQKRLEKEWNYSRGYHEKKSRAGRANALKRWKPDLADLLPSQCHGNAHHLHTEELSAPIQGRESSSVHAVGMPHTHLQSSDTSPSPAEAAGAAPLDQAQSAEPSALEDPTVRAEAIAALDHCLDALRGKAGTLAADGSVTPPHPRILEWRQRLNRLNTLASERLAGNTRNHAWDAIARADAIDDPLNLPPSLADDLNAIEALAAEAEP